MELKKYLLINKNNEKRRDTLNYLAFIKFLSMIYIIKWHIFNWKKKAINYGSRMCELLFVSSGFLVGYNHYEKNMPCDYETSFKYTYKHLRNFYPLELINIFYGFIFKPRIKLKITKIELLLSNILMTKIWSRYRDLAFSINGISWFLYVLIFCYFLSPILLQGIKKIKTSIILFILSAFIRSSIEENIFKGYLNVFDMNIHRGPIIRLLEFYMGMLLIPTFFSLKYKFDKYKNNKYLKIVFTIIQILFPKFLYYIMLKYNNKFHCYTFVFIFCAFIFITGYDYGFLSILFTKTFFIRIMSCQLEMYLIQSTINNIFNKLVDKKKFSVSFNPEIQFIIELFIIFIFGYSYKSLFKQKFAKILDQILLIIKFILF